VVKTVGSSDNPVAIDALFKEAKQLIPALTRQHILNFDAPQEKKLIDLVSTASLRYDWQGRNYYWVSSLTKLVLIK
jgi:hypothetical protein